MSGIDNNNNDEGKIQSFVKVELDDKELKEIVLNTTSALEQSELIETITQFSNACENETNRLKLGEVSTIEKLLKQLIRLLVNKTRKGITNKNMELFLQILRGLGNFSYENQKNSNLITTLLTGKQLVDIIQAFNEYPDLLISLSTTMSNIIRKTTNLMYLLGLSQAGVVDEVIKLLNHDSNTVKEKAGNAIKVLSTSAKARKILALKGAIQILVERILDEETIGFVRNQFIETLEALVILDPKNHGEYSLSLFLENNSIDQFFDHFLNGTDENYIKQLINFLIALSVKHDYYRQQFKENTVDKIVNLITGENSNENNNNNGNNNDDNKIRELKEEESLRLLSHLCINNVIMIKYYPKVKHLFKSNLESGSEQVIVYTTMLIGNLARVEQHCNELLEDDYIPIFIDNLKHENPKLQELSSICITNIGLPLQNREIIGGYDNLFESLNELLKSDKVLVVYAVIQCLKILVGSAVESNLSKFNEICIDAYINLFSNEYSESEKRILYEASRLICKLVTRNETFKNSILENNNLSKPISLLLNSRFPLLQTEGLDCLECYVNNKEQLKQIPKEVYKGLIVVCGSGDLNNRNRGKISFEKIFGEQNKPIPEFLDDLDSLMEKLNI